MPATQEEKITVSQKGVHGEGVAPHHDLAIPEALYRCENADAGIEKANDHYMDGGCFPAADLVHARFEIKEHETIYGGYFCTGCLDSLGVKRRGPTLKEALASNMLNKVCNALGLAVPRTSQEIGRHGPTQPKRRNTPLSKKTPKVHSFQRDSWSSDIFEAPAQRIMVTLTRDNVEKGYWRLAGDPVCLAVNGVMHDYACATVFWNSDGFRPQDHEDEAQLGIHVESTDPETGITTEQSYWLPLNRRAENCLKKLSNEGIETFKECRFSVLVPQSALVRVEEHGPGPGRQEEMALA